MRSATWRPRAEAETSVPGVALRLNMVDLGFDAGGLIVDLSNDLFGGIVGLFALGESYRGRVSLRVVHGGNTGRRDSDRRDGTGPWIVVTHRVEHVGLDSVSDAAARLG